MLSGPEKVTAEEVARSMRHPPYFVETREGDLRLLAALDLVLQERITAEPTGSLFAVQSLTSEKTYYVNGACTCPAALYHTRTGWCKHKIAVVLYQKLITAVEDGMALDDIVPHPDEAPTYAQELINGFPIIPIPGLRQTSGILADLARELPSDCIAQLSRKGQTISYIHWRTAARLLDAFAPGWSGYVREIQTVGTKVCVTYALTLQTAEGPITREATGQEDEAMEGYGDSTSNAEAMAFKRAAAKFGVGAYLYDKDASGAALTKELLGRWQEVIKKIDAVVDARGWKKTEFWDEMFARYKTDRRGGFSLAMLYAIYDTVRTPEGEESYSERSPFPWNVLYARPH